MQNQQQQDNQDNNGGQNDQNENDDRNQDRQNDEQNDQNENNRPEDRKDDGKGQPDKPENGNGKQPSGISREDADNILDAMQQQEDKTREKVNAQKAVTVGRSGKNW